ncbi:MAG: crossover junction endodeoxyribonuclease RuvC [Elusimicrobia bacterium]|nr:crossover junction endodeoxyribonuclease RuvC [Elusimicrobiota bacterium]
MSPLSGSGPVLGVDPGVSETGWALVEVRNNETRLLECGLVRTSPRVALPERLRQIHAALSDIVARHQPSTVAIEEMFFLKAAHTIRGTLQARGVVLLAAAQAGRPVCEYNPRTVKMTLTGSGQADKSQMQGAVKASLRLNEALRPDDVADAAAIALCHLRTSRFQRLKVLDSWRRKAARG